VALAFHVGVHRRRGRWFLACGFVIVAAACARPPAQPGADPPASPPAGAVVSSLDGVVLTVLVDPNPIPEGQHPRFVAELRNSRDEDVDFQPGACAFANLRVTIPTPWEPTGKTWAGLEAWFKDLMLQHAYGPGGGAPFSPIDATLMSNPCEESTPDILPPGATMRADFTDAIDEFMTTNAHAATIPFSITVDLDLQNSPPPIEPGYTGIRPRFFPEYHQLTANGELAMEGRRAAVLTAGQAIDAVLEDERWTTWLEAQDLPTCRTANLFLEDGQAADDGATWYISLYCETDEERHIGFAHVDAATGEVRRLEVCDKGCE